MQRFADKLVPGVNGDFWRVKVQGTPAATQNIVIDGMTNLAGMLPGDFAEAIISPEAIQEMTVFTGNQSAEHGRTGGGSLNFVLKSGTNDVHGSAFYSLQNEFLNANTWANNLQLARDPSFIRTQQDSRGLRTGRTFTKAASEAPSISRSYTTGVIAPSSTSRPRNSR